MTVLKSTTIPIAVGQSAANLTASMQQAIEKRAYERFEARNRQDSNELEDWLGAEQDILLGAATWAEMGDQVDLEVDLGNVIPGSLQLAADTRHVIMAGAYERTFQCGAEPESCSEVHPRILYRRIDLPGDVDPRRATAFLEGNILSVVLERAGSDSHAMAA